MTTGGQVVASALASVGSSSHGGLVNSFLAAVGKGPINPDGTKAGAQGASTAQPGSEQAQQEAALIELGVLSATTLSNSILHMGNKPKVEFERY